MPKHLTLKNIELYQTKIVNLIRLLINYTCLSEIRMKYDDGDGLRMMKYLSWDSVGMNLAGKFM